MIQKTLSIVVDSDGIATLIARFNPPILQNTVENGGDVIIDIMDFAHDNLFADPDTVETQVNGKVVHTEKDIPPNINLLTLMGAVK